MMETLLDIKRANAAVRKEREGNISALTAELNEAKLILSEIPNDDQFTSGQEQLAVRNKIHELNILIESEQKAIDKLTDATPEMIDLSTPLSLR